MCCAAGSIGAARNLEALRGCGVTHVVNASPIVPCFHRRAAGPLVAWHRALPRRTLTQLSRRLAVWQLAVLPLLGMPGNRAEGLWGNRRIVQQLTCM